MPFDSKTEKSFLNINRGGAIFAVCCRIMTDLLERKRVVNWKVPEFHIALYYRKVYRTGHHTCEKHRSRPHSIFSHSR